MAVLLTTPHITISIDPDTRMIRYERTTAPYPSMDDYLLMHQRAARVLDGLGRKQRVLLVDMRLAPLNNDPGFERTAARCRHLLVREFARVAVLVKTAIGALQVSRHIREDGLEIPVYQDETTATSYLLGVSGFDSVDVAPASNRHDAGSKPGSVPHTPGSRPKGSGSSGSGSTPAR
jgi:hypothetical protein